MNMKWRDAIGHCFHYKILCMYLTSLSTGLSKFIAQKSTRDLIKYLLLQVLPILLRGKELINFRILGLMDVKYCIR